MDLIVYFNKKILGDIRSKLSEVTNMHSISIVHFCSVIIQKISKGGVKSSLDENLVSMLCQIFDCVDVDSRGFINWEDFVAFALRSGRNSFKPMSGYLNVEYMQRMDVNAVMPIKKLFYCAETNLLYAFDGDSPVVRCIRRSGDVVTYFNPVIGITRLIKVRQQGKQPYFAKKNTAKQDAGKLKKKKESVLKQTVTSMTWIDRKHQMVFATSNSYLSFWNSRLVHLIDFVETAAPQLGLLYSTKADILLTWAGDKANYDYSVWDCNSRALRHQFNMHSSIILTTVEIPSLGAIVSSSMDRALYVWPVSKVIQNRDASFDDKKLVGHTYAIRTVSFAPQNDMIIGAGFDFDIFCWDPTTSSLQMKLVGHRLSIVSVAVINNPFERAASIDESGCVKIWNIDRAQGLKGGMLQSLMLQGAVSNHVFSFISAFDSGAVLACLSEKLLFMELTTTAMEDNRIVEGGLSVCEQNSRMILTSRKSSFEFSLVTGESGKVYNLVSEECIETCSTAKLVSGVEMGIVKRANNGSGAVRSTENNDDAYKDDRNASEIAISMMNKGSRNIYPDDDVTCVACDQSGKKFYAGTNSGRVLMYDGTSLGLLSQLSHEEKLSRRDDHNSGGAVVQLRYCERDEILVAAYAGGAVKVFSGCHRVVTEDITTALQTKSSVDVNELLCPFFQGGGPPQTPLLLRVNTRVHETTVMALDVSDKLGLIAVSAVDGTVRVFDYHTLLIRSIYAAPFVGSQPVEVINLSFMPLTPVLIGADSNGRFTAWTVYPMKPLWILTWSLQTCFLHMQSDAKDEGDVKDDETAEGDKSESIVSDSDSGRGIKKKSRQKRRSSTASSYSFATLVEDDISEDMSNNTVISSMKCVVWKSSSRGIKTSMNTPNRVNWSVIVGEGNGMISITNMTDVFEKMGLNDFKQLKHAYQLNGSAMVYQTIRRSDIKDGLEDFQIREIEKHVRHPIGYNCFSNSKHGFKSVSYKDVKGVVRWNAHAHGVGEIVCKQYLSPYQLHCRSQQKEFQAVNSSVKTQDYETIPSHPYLVVTSSEYGVPKRWTWTGQPVSDDSVGDMLEQAISLNNKLVNMEERDFKEKDIDSPQGLPSYPTGGAARRLATIVDWALPFVKNRIHQKATVTTSRTPVVRSSQNRDTVSSPTDDGRMSPFKSGGGGNMSDDDDDGSSSLDLFSPTRNNRTGRQMTPFVKDISSIRRKVDEDKRRKAHATQCWESKDRFPNHSSEVKKNERHHKDISEEEVKELLGLIEEVKSIPSTDAVLKKSYAAFISKRNEMHSTINKKLVDKNASLHKEKMELSLEIDTSSNDLTEHELFSCDIRNLRGGAPLIPRAGSPAKSKASPLVSTPNSRKARKKATHSNDMSPFSTKNKGTTPGSSALVSKSGRKLITKTDSNKFYSREIEDITHDAEDEEVLKELGLVIKRRERPKSSRLESISNIEATISRFDKITSADDKKYSYTFNHYRAQIRGRKKKVKTTERLVAEDPRGGGYEENQQGIAMISENGAGRYGPYKGRDIAAFEDFMSRLPPLHAAVDFTSLDLRIGEYFPDILSCVHMGLVYEMSEILPIVLGFNNKSMTAMIKDLNVRLDGTFLRRDLFLSVFPFASKSERIRIQKFSMIRAVLIEIFKGLKPPPEAVDHAGKFNSPAGRHQSSTFTSPNKNRGNNVAFTESSQSLQQGVAPSRKLFHDRSNKALPESKVPQSTAPTPATPSGATPHKNTSTRQVKSTSGLEGWSMDRSVLEDVKTMCEDLFVDKNGTVVGSEVIEIAQFACSCLNVEKPPDMSFLALRRSFPLTAEVNSDLIAQLFEEVLRIDVKNDSGYVIPTQNSGSETPRDNPEDEENGDAVVPVSASRSRARTFTR